VVGRFLDALIDWYWQHGARKIVVGVTAPGATGNLVCLRRPSPPREPSPFAAVTPAHGRPSASARAVRCPAFTMPLRRHPAGSGSAEQPRATVATCEF